MSNYSLHLINIASQNAIQLSGIATIDQERLFGLIRSIAQMGQNIGSSGIVNVELQNERVFAYNSIKNTDNLLLLIVPNTANKEKVISSFDKFLNKLFIPNQTVFSEALDGSNESLEKAKQLAARHFKKITFLTYQSRLPVTLNVTIGIITTLAIAELVIALPMLLPETTYSYYANIASTYSSLLASAFIFLVAFKYGLKNESGRIWFILGIAFSFMTLAEGSWGVLDVFFTQDPYPSIADAFWIVGYVIMLVALILEDRAVRIPRNKILTIIWTLIILGGAVTVYFTLANDIFFYEDYNFWEKSVSTFYVFWDLILIFMLGLIFFKYRQGKIGVSWLLIMIGIVITAAADIMYSYTEWLEVYENWIRFNDPMFVSGYYLIAIAGVLHLKTLIYEEMLLK